MLQSMTSYGQSMLSTEYGELGCEIRSLNHRYLDVTVRLPEILRSIEAVLKEKMSTQASRGKIDIVLKLDEPADRTQPLVLNQDALQQLSDVIVRMQALPADIGQCDPLSLLQWPGVVRLHSQSDEALIAAALSCFDQALEDFLSTRSREGQQIAQMLETRAVQLKKLVEDLHQHRPGVFKRQREKLLNRLAQLGTEHDEARLEQELVYAAQRLDIDEELDRMAAHLQELAKVLERDEAVGRRLDFLMQEFNREANTIASKASDSTTTAMSIDMKVLIEQIREQVQNVE